MAASFFDLPEDVQLTIISFLSPTDISTFAATSRRSLGFCSQPKFWLSLCHSRWASKTHLPSWTQVNPTTTTTTTTFSFRLYKLFSKWDRLIGFWRHPCHRRFDHGKPALVLFEWGRTHVVGSRVLPAEKERNDYGVEKRPFLWLGVSPEGKEIGFVGESSEISGGDLVVLPVNLSFVGDTQILVECSKMGMTEEDESDGFLRFVKGMGFDWEGKMGREIGRRRRMSRRWESDDFLKIEDCYPTPSRPLQGLWKGICENGNLDFFLVTYDEAGGITCRRLFDSREHFPSYSPVFWSSNTTFMEPPFRLEEKKIYDRFVHVQPASFNSCYYSKGIEIVSRILRINSSYDLVIPDMSGSQSANLWNVEGRIWEYEDGTFGFGFLRNNLIIDMKPMSLVGCLLDASDY